MRKIFLFLFLISCSNIFAATRTAVMTGNWFTPATWGGTVPVAADVAVIPAGFTVTINLPTAGVINTPWNNSGAIKVFGKLILTGTDPLFNNPCVIEVYSGGEFNDNTDWGEYWLTETSILKVYTGGKYTSVNYTTNFIDANHSNTIHYVFPSSLMNGPLTLTVSGGQITFTASVLPLRLTSFTAKETGAANELNWQTANEINTSGFDIERSSDGVHYTSIGTVSATGLAVNNYSFTDPIAINGTSFYRLKMSDADGRATYSDVLRLNRDAAGRISVYPSPAKDIIHIVTGIEGKVVIFNAEGKLVRSQILPAGNSIIDISTLSDGIYFIEQAGRKISFMKATH